MNLLGSQCIVNNDCSSFVVCNYDFVYITTADEFACCRRIKIDKACHVIDFTSSSYKNASTLQSVQPINALDKSSNIICGFLANYRLVKMETWKYLKVNILPGLR